MLKIFVTLLQTGASNEINVKETSTVQQLVERIERDNKIKFPRDIESSKRKDAAKILHQASLFDYLSKWNQSVTEAGLTSNSMLLVVQVPPTQEVVTVTATTQTLHRSRAMTRLPQGILDIMLTQSNQKVSTLAEGHRVLLIFLPQSEQASAEIITKVTELYPVMLQCNAVPVLVYRDDPQRFLERSIRPLKSEICENLPRCHDTAGKYARAFGVPDNATKQTLFVIENDKIVHEYRNDTFPDYMRLVIDPEKEGERSDQIVDSRLCNREEMRRKSIFMCKPDRKVNIHVPPEEEESAACTCFGTPSKREEPRPPSIKENSEVVDVNIETVNHILRHSTKRRYLMLFCARELSVENILFWEEVNLKYKELKSPEERRKLAEKMIDNYFDPNSIYGININNKLRNSVIKRLEGPPDIDIFDRVVKDLEIGVLTDTYTRFKSSELYAEMKKKCKK
jgi:hypothetical protein